MRNTASLHTEANGFASISTFSFRKRLRLGLLLTFRYGFWRWGVWVPPMFDDTGVYPEFIRGRKRIAAGYDNWFGYDLTATTPEADEFLRWFYEKHVSLKEQERPVSPNAG